jgi:hypothetical protein
MAGHNRDYQKGALKRTVSELKKRRTHAPVDGSKTNGPPKVRDYNCCHDSERIMRVHRSRVPILAFLISVVVIFLTTSFTAAAWQPVTVHYGPIPSRLAWELPQTSTGVVNECDGLFTSIRRSHWHADASGCKRLQPVAKRNSLDSFRTGCTFTVGKEDFRRTSICRIRNIVLAWRACSGIGD